MSSLLRVSVVSLVSPSLVLARRRAFPVVSLARVSGRLQARGPWAGALSRTSFLSFRLTLDITAHLAVLRSYVSPDSVTLWTAMNPVSNAAIVVTVHKEPAAAAPAAATASAAAGAAAAAGASNDSSTTCASGAAGAAAAAAPAAAADKSKAKALPFPEEEPFVCGRLHVLRAIVPGSNEFSYYSLGKIRLYWCCFFHAQLDMNP